MSSLRSISAKKVAESYRSGDISVEDLLVKTNDDTLLEVLEELRSVRISPVKITAKISNFYVFFEKGIYVNLNRMVDMSYQDYQYDIYEEVTREHSSACKHLETYLRRRINTFYYIHDEDCKEFVQNLSKMYDLNMITIDNILFIEVVKKFL